MRSSSFETELKFLQRQKKSKLKHGRQIEKHVVQSKKKPTQDKRIMLI